MGGGSEVVGIAQANVPFDCKVTYRSKDEQRSILMTCRTSFGIYDGLLSSSQYSPSIRHYVTFK